MYQPLLTRRYLRSKVMPLLAAFGVALSVCMVLVVWSVMGGFLNMLLNSGKTMIGDVSINRPVDGIPHYADLIQRLENDPRIAAAAPVIESPGLLNLPAVNAGFDARGKPRLLREAPRLVAVLGVEPESFDRVTNLFERLYWTPIEEQTPDAPLAPNDLRLDPAMSVYAEHGRAMAEPDPDTGRPRPAAILGVDVSGFNRRTDTGAIDPRVFFMPDERITLSVVPISGKGAALDTVDRAFPVANEFRTGLAEADAKQVLVPLPALQQMLELDEQQIIDPDWSPTPVFDPSAGEMVIPEPEIVGTEPARVTRILVRAANNTTANDAEAASNNIYNAFAADHQDAPARVQIYTWENQPGLRTFIAAVKKEIALVLFLFVIISLTAVVLILAIFWSMVSEKTKDIGILRSIGASRLGISWLYVRFGLAIGITGSAAGAALAALIVTNINEIHAWLGTTFDLVIWDPAIYHFFRIPSDLDATKFIAVCAAGVLSAALGALVPALRAATLDPVKALRFE